MAIITTAPTNPQLGGITRRVLLQDVLMETGLGEYGTCTATSGGAATTYFDDTNNLKSTQYDSKKWVGGWTRISYDAAGAAAAPENEVGPITTYDPTTNGRITFAPAMTAAPTTGDKYEIWTNPNPKRVIDIVDKIITEDLFMPCWTVLTECPDGDMEQNNTTDWTASNATLTKVSIEPVMYGKRYLKVLSTAANGYARSALHYGQPSQKYHVSALVRCSAASTTAKMIIYDETNGAEIDSITSVNLFNVRLWKEITLPATCYTWSVRLSNVENNVTTYWDEVCTYPLGAHDIKLPWWMKQKKQKLGVFKMMPITIDDYTYDGGLRGELDRTWDVQEDRIGGHGLRLQQRPTLGAGLSTPLFIYGLRNEEAYSNDNSDEKSLDTNLLLNWTCWKIFDWIATRPVSGQQNIGGLLANRDKYKLEALKLQRQQLNSLSSLIESPPTFTQTNDYLSTLRYS